MTHQREGAGAGALLFSLSTAAWCYLLHRVKRHRRSSSSRGITLDSVTVDKLASAKLCEFITTSHTRPHAEHSVCMTFTPLADPNSSSVGTTLIVMTSQANSKKVRNLLLQSDECKIIATNRQPNIDVGINDTSHVMTSAKDQKQQSSSSSPSPSLSQSPLSDGWRVTLHCRATVIPEISTEESSSGGGALFHLFRDEHLKSNPGYRDFILAKNNVVLLLRPYDCQVQGSYVREDAQLHSQFQ